MAKVSPVPRGYHSITAALVVKNADQAIKFYEKAFGAKMLRRMYLPDGKTIMHAELKIGDSHLMLSDEMPQMQALSPQTVGGASSSIYLYVKNVDKVFDQAVKAGATSTMPVMDAFWGDRMGGLTDPFGHMWAIATRKKNLTAKQMKKAGEEFMASMGKAQA
ncbi:MAG: VOC family protein [Nitrososphaera sp.]|uniref:VOC family protein n=1 Tax=Nitrososphaera sp. TaxID=1971748 RepID=UPI003D6F8FBF